ncbi:DUF6392 family protein [Pseudomonas sp.]|uniref:DUF6392 family protein n=1 Tax=Pseudomonas sp. TaxID=306 RepID=UPI0028AD3261|nr:DUF6392 family protein [Pseudomonas sp.]
MNTRQLEIYLESLGKAHHDLISSGVVSTQQFIEVYPGSWTLYLQPEKGLDLVFWAETKILERLIIALIETFPSEPIYEHEIPSPYDACTSRESTIRVLGAPIESRAAFIMPFSLEEVGGWDKFRVAGSDREDLVVVATYDKSLQVTGFCFSLKRTEADILQEQFGNQK